MVNIFQNVEILINILPLSKPGNNINFVNQNSFKSTKLKTVIIDNNLDKLVIKEIIIRRSKYSSSQKTTVSFYQIET